jgi:hypothetical protein
MTTGIDEIIDCYIALEKELQKLIHQVIDPFCSKCRGACCKAEICKETIESSFLENLIKKQQIQYDNRSGWLGASGCRLEFGRPLVCYEFFCEDVLKNAVFKASHVQAIINDFVSIGKNAHGSMHLVCVENLDCLSSTKIKKIYDNIRLNFHALKRTTKV